MPTYQLLLHQPLAVSIDSTVTQPFPMFPDNRTPAVVMRAVHEDEANRLSEGGTRIGIEFESEEEDLVRAVSQGAALGDDFLAAVCLSSGIPFPSSTPLQIVREGRNSSIEFLRFLPFEGSSWPESLTESTLRDAARIQLHWRDLDGGHRLRRAARRYRRALASRDPLEGFQHAYSGLESIEKPLADEIGIAAGAETVTGTCKSCGASYEYRRTVLAGVRAFVRGQLHVDASEIRSDEWRALNTLRNDLLHGRGDLDDLTAKSRDLMATVCHYLHDASVHLAHVHELETDQFRLARFGKRFVIRGKAHLPSLPPLLQQTLLMDAGPLRWVEDEEYGLVPEHQIVNRAGAPVEGEAFVLEDGFGDRSERDLKPTKWRL